MRTGLYGWMPQFYFGTKSTAKKITTFVKKEIGNSVIILNAVKEYVRNPSNGVTESEAYSWILSDEHLLILKISAALDKYIHYAKYQQLSEVRKEEFAKKVASQVFEKTEALLQINLETALDSIDIDNVTTIALVSIYGNQIAQSQFNDAILNLPLEFNDLIKKDQIELTQL